MTNTAIIPTNSIEGNIGSCSVQTSRTWVDSFTAREFATNSCTGEIISDNTFTDWTFLYFPLVVVFIIVAVFAVARKIFG